MKINYKVVSKTTTETAAGDTVVQVAHLRLVPLDAKGAENHAAGVIELHNQNPPDVVGMSVGSIVAVEYGAA